MQLLKIAANNKVSYNVGLSVGGYILIHGFGIINKRGVTLWY